MMQLLENAEFGSGKYYLRFLYIEITDSKIGSSIF